MIKYGSRKFIALMAGMVLIVAIPILYSKLGIGEAVTLVVVGAIGTGVGLYTGFNVLEKKISK
jgi:hypothetical protein